MAASDDEATVLSKIQDTYVPFLKKLIAFLEKNKKATPDSLKKLKAIFTIFTTAPSHEQVETFYANQKKLENWYNKAQKEKHSEDGETKGTKRTIVSSDTESSQGASDSGPSSAKRSTFSNSVNSQSTAAVVQNTNQSVTPIPISQIKKEKIDTPKSSQNSQLKTVTPKSSASAILPAAPLRTLAPAVPKAPDPVPAVDPNEPITFTCASCQFQTKDETEFMKHARTDHRTDLSMWCKQCGKCFSNAGVLVSHIKERACIKEEMIYKCGVKDCIFETTSGQTFVHHLRHCHKGSPFIFCVHCQKIFTLPHCLILHMQDDCPFKDKNRRNPTAAASVNDKPPDPKPNSNTSITKASFNVATTPQPRPQAPTTVYTPRQVMPTVTPNMGPGRPSSIPTMGTSIRSRGRGRGRGKGRGRTQYSDSSESDDPDDPSWRPEETLGDAGVRRSARWAKKINDVRNPEPSTSGVVTSSKKSFSSADLNTKMINCPCCDFMAAFQSVLEDHYIASHKLANKIACLVCHLKFENTRAFLDHFEEHRKGTLPNKPPSEVLETAKATEPKHKELPSNIVPSSTGNNLPIPSEDKEIYDGVLTSIEDAKLADPKGNKDAIKIPYQAAIHDKNLKDSKLKKFEELKSSLDLIAMKTVEKLKHFFKCGLYNCTYTTDSTSEFSSHLLMRHEGKRYHCCYCLKEYFNCDSMANHIALNHNKRVYQCSKCFYRGYSKAHVQIHIKNSHNEDSLAEILVCTEVESPSNKEEQDSIDEVKDTTWPYVCAIGECTFNTFDPKEFKRHNETVHRTVSVFFCHYCKVDFLTFKRLMNHYRLHGLNTFQCNYCIHGADTKEEILLHLCNSHADSPLKAYMRGSHEEASSEERLLNNVICEDSNSSSNIDTHPVNKVSAVDTKDNFLTEAEKELYHVIDNKYYPKELQFACFPRYTPNLVSEIICGIPFCEGKFDNLSLYVSHLRNIHDALNYPCPHCIEKLDTLAKFKNHLLCHGSKLYVCGASQCEYYDWNKEIVRRHKIEHEAENTLAVREYSTDVKEEKSLAEAFSTTSEIPDVENAYECLFCHYQCSDHDIMKNHLYKELAYLRFHCRLCDKRFLNRRDLKNHFISLHAGLDIICSIQCNSELENIIKTILKMQNKFKNIKLSESCVMCCRKIKNPLRLQNHLYICLQKEYHPYECNHCKKTYVNLLALRYHTSQNHQSKLLEFSVVDNHAVEEDIEKNLLKIRLKQLKDLFTDLEIGVTTDEESRLKFYTCSVCEFEAVFKFSVQKHIKEQHNGINAHVIKAKQKQEPNENTDENSDEETSKKYTCGFCVRKMYTIQAVENHMRKVHPSKIGEEYFYYFTPDDESSSSSDYECAYCKSSRENLQSLKKHADLMHSDMQFKVKGFVCRFQIQNYLACGYCYLHLETYNELEKHCRTSHALLPPKSIGDILTNKSKRANESAEDIPNKRIKLGSLVYVCTYCGGAFSGQDKITVHCSRAHKSQKVDFYLIHQTAGNPEQDVKFYKCEFCKYTSERQYLDKHLAAKHKMRVTCSYCHKRFEFASKLKEHHEEAHKDLPLKYSQETVNNSTTETSHTGEPNPKISEEENTIPDPISYYKKAPEPIDLSSLTVHMEIKEGESANLPVVYVIKKFNMFPEVVLKDCKKQPEYIQ